MINAHLTVSADVVGSSFANDPELHLPEYPRFPSEILVLPYQQSGLLFEGARGTQVLNGRGARGFIPRLLERLDGTRRLDQLVLDFAPVRPQTVRDAIALLYSRGLLEDGVSPQISAELSEVAAFCGRYVDVTRVNRNRGEVLDRLARARVALVASENVIATTLTAALQGQGVGHVAKLERAEQLQTGWDLLVGIFTSGTTQTQRWMDAAWKLGVRVLHASINGAAVEIGPLFVPGKSACYDCLREIRPATADDVAVDAGFWAGVVGLHAFHLLSRIGNPSLYNVCHVHVRSPHGAGYEEVKIARLPGCVRCGLEGRSPRLHERNGLVWLLHNAANSMPPQELLSPRDYQMHYAAANLQITKETPEPYYGAEKYPLPDGMTLEIPPAWGRTARPVAAQPMLEGLASLLRFAVGNRISRRRIAPSAGGMGSAEIFMVVRQLAGLDAGVYHYYAHEHCLERLRPTSDQELAGALGIIEVELPPVLLVGVASLIKLRQKYNDFAFRFASLDAGVARAYLTDILNAWGMPFHNYAEARDKIVAQAISLPTAGTRNIVTYALGLGTPPGRTDLGLIAAHHYVDVLSELAGKRDVPESALGSSVVRSVLPDRAATSLGEILLQRKSVRSFTGTALPRDVLTAIVTTACTVDADLAGHGGLDVRTKVWIALNTAAAGDTPGVYLWDSQTGRLQTIRSELTSARLSTLMLQHSLAEAPAILLITGDFGHAVTQFGARGYRELMMRAGALAARALAVAWAYGISGCPWGGLSEDGWGELLNIDRYTDCPLFGVCLGYAAAEH